MAFLTPVVPNLKSEASQERGQYEAHLQAVPELRRQSPRWRRYRGLPTLGFDGVKRLQM